MNKTAEIHYLPEHRLEYALKSDTPEKSVYWHFCQARDYRLVSLEANNKKKYHLNKVKEKMKLRELLTYAGKLLATWKWHTRTVLNEELLKERYPEIHEECSEEVEYRAFVFK